MAAHRPRSDAPVPAVPMPAILSRPATWLALMAVLLVPFFVQIPMSLRRNIFIAPLGDQFHVVLLGGVTLMLYWRGPCTGRLLRAAVAAAIIGGAIEFLQLLVGRAALFNDFLLDLVGIGLVVGWILWRGHGLRRGLFVFCLLALCIPAQLYYVPGQWAAAHRARGLFPVLADFEKGRDRWLWHTNNNGEHELAVIDDTPSGPGRVLRMTGGPPNHWPGSYMKRFPHDWSGHATLEFAARCVGTDSLPFGVRLEDFEGAREDHYTHANFVATSGWTVFTIALDELEMIGTDRPFDATDVDFLGFYLPRPAAPGVLEIDDLRVR